MAWSIESGLREKTVLVTGAASGIGKSVATAFAEVGARVCAVDINEAGVNELVATFDDPDDHLAVGFDVTNTGEQDRLLRDVEGRLGNIYALANVAAVVRRTELADVTEDDWALHTDVNLKASFFLSRNASMRMCEHGDGGVIVNFTSQSWWTGGYGGAAVYAAGKGGIVSFSRGLARSLGPYGIRVNTIAPGIIDTPMLRPGLSADALDSLVAEIPLGRLGEPEEVASVVIFLASDHGRYISGATINISGGFLMY